MSDMTPEGRAMARHQESARTITTEEAPGMVDLLSKEVTALTKNEDVSESDGPRAMRRMICEDMRHALGARATSRARDLYAMRQHPVAAHLEAVGAQ